MPKASVVSQGVRGILMILSPAKTLDLSPLDSCVGIPTTLPDCSPPHTREIAQAMKKRTELELAKLLGISKTLASTSKGYWDDFLFESVEKENKASKPKPCVFAFSGPAYQGLKASECSTAALTYLQNNLRIVDAVYGALRPMDLVQPYRLEMGTKKVLENVKLADYWSNAVTTTLIDELKQRTDPILLNLASDEYAAAVDSKQLPEESTFIKAVFQEEGRVVAVHAKRARGLMARYLAENEVTSVDEVKRFTEEGYFFVEKRSDDTKLVFDRKKQAPKRAAAADKKTSQSKKRK